MARFGVALREDRSSKDEPHRAENDRGTTVSKSGPPSSQVAEELARPNFQSFHGYLRALAGLARHGGAKNGDRALGALEAMNRTVGSVGARAYQTAVYVRRGAATPSHVNVRVSSVGARRSKRASRW